MPRVSDVDTIAPDDLSTEATIKPAPKKIKHQSAEVPSQPLPAPGPSVVDRVYKIMGHTKSPLSSMLVHPDIFNFQERDDNETILIVARQHWFTNVRWIAVTFFMICLPTLIRFVPTLITLPASYQFVGYLFWYLITFSYAFENFLSWYFNVYIITNKRVIDIDFNNLLTKKYSEAGIDQVQDVTSSVVGAIPTVFNYGTVLIQTASEVNELEFGRVPNPEKIIKVLQELRDHQGGKE